MLQGLLPLAPVLAALLGLALLAGCARPGAVPSAPIAGPGEKRLDVPFFAQADRQCGPAALAGVMRFWGLDASPESVSAEVFSAEAGGTLDIDLLLFARRHGMAGSITRGSFEDITRNIDAGRPVILFVDYGIWLYHKGHFLTVIGYGPGTVIAHTGIESGRAIPVAELARSWSKTDNWTLVVTPREHAQN
jgi:ABC-type bacteriocin/lantibiotic exporter with double-glycine peptidase domain